MRSSKYIVFILLILILFSPQKIEAKTNDSDIITPQPSQSGSSFLVSTDDRLEFMMMDNWKMIKNNRYEYIITADINGAETEIGGIEVLTRDRNYTPTGVFRSLKESGGNYILIEDKLIQKENHSQYLIKWIKDKKYYVDVYIMNSMNTSYHVSLCGELAVFEKLYQQFENFIATLNIRDDSSSKGLQTYYNNVDKYIIHVPEGWLVDNSREFACTSFYSPGIGKVDIYKQPLDGISADTYIWYSNKKIVEGMGETQLLFKRDFNDGVNRIVEYMWRKPTLKNTGNDYNYYWEINIVPEHQQHVYTYILRTDKENINKAVEDFKIMLSGFEYSDYGIVMYKDRKDGPDNHYAVDIEGRSTKLSIPENKTLIGIFTSHTPGNYLKRLKSRENDIGNKFEFVMTYSSFDDEFPKEDVKQIYDDGRIMMLTMHPWKYKDLMNLTLPKIIDGQYDQYIRNWASSIRELGEPVFIRFANEMNGDWDPWCAWFYGKDHDIYIEAWKRVYNLFRQEGADNAYFVWNPHDRSYPDFKWNNPHLYYPGDQYVDWIGMTGYNNGTSYKWDKWREFDSIYNDIYNEYRELYPDKPIMITEFSSNEEGGDKAGWIQDAFRYLSDKYTGIKIVVWFNQVDGKWNYPIDSSSASKRAFIEGIKMNRYQFNAVK